MKEPQCVSTRRKQGGRLRIRGWFPCLKFSLKNHFPEMIILFQQFTSINMHISHWWIVYGLHIWNVKETEGRAAIAHRKAGRKFILSLWCYSKIKSYRKWEEEVESEKGRDLNSPHIFLLSKHTETCSARGVWRLKRHFMKGIIFTFNTPRDPVDRCTVCFWEHWHGLGVENTVQVNRWK